MILPPPHRPVLLQEVLTLFATHPRLSLVVDCTVGYGGHSEAILNQFPTARLIGIDQDPEAIAYASERLLPYAQRVRIDQGRFSEALVSILQEERVDALLADVGVSSLQLDKKGRGFSFFSDRLDMRMDPSAPLSAYEVVNHYERSALERVVREYGEIRSWRKVVDAIIEARRRKPIESGEALAQVAARVLPKKGQGSHPATALFQAIRIEVNDELGEIERTLALLQAYPPSGAIVTFITFHSLEDRLVKQAFTRWSKACICPPEQMRCSCGGDRALGVVLTKKPIVASKEELAQNRRSRSAKLRSFRFKE